MCLLPPRHCQILLYPPIAALAVEAVCNAVALGYWDLSC